ncbi:MAG: hypothetical protein ACR2RV_25045 [Verrucomicrobiales bacterium]
MSDSPQDDSPTPQPSISDDQAAAIQSAKPLAPRPRPAFTRKSKAKKSQEPAPEIDLNSIPEAVPLDDIPEGIPVVASSPTIQTTMEKPAIRTPGNRPIRPKHAPRDSGSASAEAEAETEAAVEKAPIDKSKFANFESYEKGEITVKPLEKSPGVESRQVQRVEKPKFLDGELSRRIERGVQYPLPGRVIFTSVMLLLFKFTLLLTLVGLTFVAIFAEEELGYALWLPVALIVIGLIFVSSANRTRCRICSCHMFYNRRCFKHQKAHHVFGLGHGGSAALHAILFKWLRCMYCGTAIRLRPPKPDSQEAEARRNKEARAADYDKSLIKPRSPK